MNLSGTSAGALVRLSLLGGIMFSKRHYQFLADWLKEIPDNETKMKAVELLYKKLKQDNPRFKDEKFLNACYKDGE